MSPSSRPPLFRSPAKRRVSSARLSIECESGGLTDGEVAGRSTVRSSFRGRFAPEACAISGQGMLVLLFGEKKQRILREAYQIQPSRTTRNCENEGLARKALSITMRRTNSYQGCERGADADGSKVSMVYHPCKRSSCSH
jgi:hypothetical protein